MRSKPRLSFWQIWNMSFGFSGHSIRVCIAKMRTYPAYSKPLVANIDDIPILWIAAPVTGLIVQPIIGYYSDRTWNRLGRRRPYFLIGAILASLALIIMPNSPYLWFAAGMLWIMDASINVSMEPFRAFVGDNLPDEQSTSGFAMQSFFIGTGAVIASLLPYILANWFDVANQAPEGIVPDSVKWSFYVGAVIFFLAVLWTVVKSKEYSPEEMAAFEDNQEEINVEEVRSEQNAQPSSQLLTYGGAFAVIGAILIVLIRQFELKKELFILGGGLLIFGILFLLVHLIKKSSSRSWSAVQIVEDVMHMPKTMKQLAWVQFFSWFALFAMWIYTTSAVTSHVYGTSDTTSALYNDGANWVGICFAVYNGVAAIVAFLLPILAKKYNRKITHMICLVLGAIGLCSVLFISQPNLLLVSMIGVGFAWASILAMPYAMLTGALPGDKMGYYMGVFNFFIVIPQMVAASILGFLVTEFFDGQAVYALIIGGISFVIAAVMTHFVEDKAKQA